MTITKTSGENVRWKDEDILLLALLSIGDADDATRIWRRLSDRRFSMLLGAAYVDAIIDAANLKDIPVWFDLNSLRYGLSDKGFIPPEVIRAAVETFRRRAAEDLKRQAQTMIDGMPIDQWQAAMADELKAIYLAMAAMAWGGFDGMSSPQLAAASKALEFPLQRLNDFAQDVADKTISDSRIVTRANAYGLASITSYWQAERKLHEDAGFTEELNMLGIAEHCKLCLQETDKGWVPIGTLIPLGERLCLYNEKCHLVFRKT